MTAKGAQASVTYLGWSGFDLRIPGASPVLIDPVAGRLIPDDEDICLIVTHGHPEHISGAAAYLAKSARTGCAAVFASPRVIRYLKRRSHNDGDRFHNCRPGDTHIHDTLSIDVFACQHMPLLAPEKGEARRRLGQFAGNPRLAASIVGAVFRHPFPGPTLGFRLKTSKSAGILFYGEGLHRCASRDDIAKVAERFAGDTLIAAVELEDVAVMPELVSATAASAMVPYEAHLPWRKGFGMGWADLDALSSRLVEAGVEIVRADQDRSVPLPARR